MRLNLNKLNANDSETQSQLDGIDNETQSQWGRGVWEIGRLLR